VTSIDTRYSTILPFPFSALNGSDCTARERVARIDSSFAFSTLGVRLFHTSRRWGGGKPNPMPHHPMSGKGLFARQRLFRFGIAFATTLFRSMESGGQVRGAANGAIAVFIIYAVKILRSIFLFVLAAAYCALARTWWFEVYDVGRAGVHNENSS
jgi:hypothetical protein